MWSRSGSRCITPPLPLFFFAGIHEYPTSGVSLGMPTWYLHNTITGENRTIWGQNKPQVRENAPNGAAVDWWRRAVYHDISSYDTLAKDNYTIISGPNEPRTYYAIRNDTTSAPRPPGNTCNGDQDVIVPFTALYTMLSCDTDIAAYMPPPMLLAPVMAPPPLIELVPALAPVVDAVPPAVVPAPAVVDAVPPTITTEPIMASPIIAAPVVVPANTTAPPPTSAALPRNGQLALGLFAAAAYALL